MMKAKAITIIPQRTLQIVIKKAKTIRLPIITTNLLTLTLKHSIPRSVTPILTYLLPGTTLFSLPQLQWALHPLKALQ